MSELPKFPYLKADELGKADKDRFLAELIKWRSESVARLEAELTWANGCLEEDLEDMWLKGYKKGIEKGLEALKG